MSIGVHGMSRTPEHYTSQWLVEMITDVVGCIDFDPASCSHANAIVGATTYYSLRERGEDATILPWPRGITFINPPGDSTGKLVKTFWKLAMDAHEAGSTVVWVGFNLAQIATLQSIRSPMEWPTCIPRRRIAYDTLARPGSDVSLWVDADTQARSEGLTGAQKQARADELVTDWISGPVVRIPTTAPPKNSFVTLVTASEAMKTAFRNGFSVLGDVVVTMR